MVSEFSQKVYDALITVPSSRVTTYRDLAHMIGSRNYRAVGQALRHNPFAPQVPCHRVVKADGSIGGFMGEVEGPAIAKKITLLKSEGVLVKDGRIVEFEQRLFRGVER